KLTKGTDDFVGIFANLSKAAGTATVEADTKATLVSKNVPLEHMQLATMDRSFLPELVIDVSSPLEDGHHAIEYSWWIDKGTRSSVATGSTALRWGSGDPSPSSHASRSAPRNRSTSK